MDSILHTFICNNSISNPSIWFTQLLTFSLYIIFCICSRAKYASSNCYWALHKFLYCNRCLITCFKWKCLYRKCCAFIIKYELCNIRKDHSSNDGLKCKIAVEYCHNAKVLYHVIITVDVYRPTFLVKLLLMLKQGLIIKQFN